MVGRKIPSSSVLLVMAALLPLGGCASSVQYVIRQGLGQLCMMTRTVPIEQVLADGSLSAEQERKLRLVVAARDFARDELGLRVGGSYSLYHDSGGEPIGYNLSAARQDALTPRRWHFPIIGTIDYIGFFERADAEDAAAELEQEGYDTYIYGVDAYSTLGWFPDPVQSSFLNRPDGSIVETVIHELAHNTIYVSGQSTFNESLATFIGRAGARRYYEREGAAGEEVITALEVSYADQERITAWLLQLAAELEAHYGQEISSAEKVAGREAVFQAARERFTSEVLPELSAPERHEWWSRIPTNNAFVLLRRRYHLDLDVFAAVYDAVGGEFPALFDALRDAAGAADPFARLRELAGSR